MTTTSNAQLFASGTEVEKVDRFIYLGQLINYPRDHNKELGRRIGSAWASFGKARKLLTNKNISMNIKHRYFQQCIVPSLLYGCETWALTKTMELRLLRCQRAIERRFLNIRLLDKKPSTWVRQKTKLKDIIGLYRKRKLKHAHKMLDRNAEGRWDTRLLNWIPPTSRPLGRPRTRWQDAFKATLGPNWHIHVHLSSYSQLLSSFIVHQLI